MTQTLPASIAAYFDAANRRDFDRAAAQFSADARVRDESRDHIGRAAIENWLKQTVDAYDFHAEPGPAEHRDGAVFVSAKVSGSFPGSPIALTYRFGMDADRIAALEIA
ncbi:nuclear transport factor 2 family protein [Maricaulis sp.]|uniref:nuclear transport factor 2 family protein n=1 Tax=Maricaulis sp. TaxID=1486257 RepID=UPI00329A0046